MSGINFEVEREKKKRGKNGFLQQTSGVFDTRVTPPCKER
jgi:hypothetical protein